MISLVKCTTSLLLLAKIIIILSSVNTDDAFQINDVNSNNLKRAIQGTGVYQFSSDQIIDGLLYHTNVERRHHQLKELRYNVELAKAAQHHAMDMAQKYYFSHTGLDDGSEIADRVKKLTNYQYQLVGENLFWQSPTNNPADAVDGWMNSPGHRENLLNGDFTEIGLGYATDGQNRNNHYFVAVYGTPLPYSASLSVDGTREYMFHLTNMVRRQSNVNDIRASAQLNAAAQDHAEYMARNGKFENKKTSLLDGINGYRVLGSNFAYREPFSNPEEVIEGSMNEKSGDERYECYILNRQFSEMGIGYAPGDGGEGHYYVQLFGIPSNNT